MRTIVSAGAQVRPAMTGLGGYGATNSPSAGRAGAAASVATARVRPARATMDMAWGPRRRSTVGHGRGELFEPGPAKGGAVADGDQVQARHDDQVLVAGAGAPDRIPRQLREPPAGVRPPPHAAVVR